MLILQKFRPVTIHFKLMDLAFESSGLTLRYHLCTLITRASLDQRKVQMRKKLITHFK